ncbi:DNA gyrase subunit A, partial [Flavobacteriales bacterium]|nr:DNA gyrase subunit A [Flavobacteriales bacterium]
QTPEEARSGLMEKFELSEIQARAILDMRLQKLTGLERGKLRAEYDELMEVIGRLQAILADKALRMDIIKGELEEMKERFGDERRSRIEFSSAELSIEDMIPDEQVVITISHAGYIKRTRLAEYKEQSRGGVGSKGAVTRDADFIEEIFSATNHNWLLIFTQKGRCFWMRIFEVPEGSRTSKGRAIQNLMNIESDDKVMAYIPVLDIKDPEYVNAHNVVMCTKKGVIKKTSLEAYSRPRTNGINAITIREDDELLQAKLTDGSNEILMGLRSGKAIRFPEEKVRAVGRTAQGVKGVTLAGPQDEVVGMVIIVDGSKDVLVVSQNGYGKRSAVEDYRITNRGGKGVKTLSITEKTGELVAILGVTDEDDLMVINKSGITIRTGADELRTMGRATQGVRLINLRKNDSIAAVCRTPKSDEEGVDGIEGEEGAPEGGEAASNETAPEE